MKFINLRDTRRDLYLFPLLGEGIGFFFFFLGGVFIGFYYAFSPRPVSTTIICS